MSSTDQPAHTFAILEIFGHRQHAGILTEEERFGAKMARIDVPTIATDGSETVTTHYYGGAAIFSITHTDEATVRRINRRAAPSLYLPSGDDAGDLIEDEDAGD